jgi:hypothetical protein
VVLNQRLYQLLDRNIPGGVVKIANEGQVRRQTTIFDFRTEQLRSDRVCSGEEYQLHCPFCGDRGAHLSVSHLYGVPDKDTDSPNLHLAHCYRRGCLDNPNNRHQFSIWVYGGLAYDHRTRGQHLPAPAEVEEHEGPIEPVELPQPFTPIVELPSTHSARQYLWARGYDIRELWETWGVGYAPIFCTDRKAAGRIVIPVRLGGVCVGWQARYAGYVAKGSKVRKYLNSSRFPKRKLLYNCDLASREPFVVVCEGVTDVYAVGRAGVALFGKSASPEQEDLLVRYWGDKVILLLLDNDDPDAQAKAAQLEQRLRPRVRGGLLRVQLPGNSDPGDYPRENLRDFLRATAAANGIELKEKAAS